MVHTPLPTALTLPFLLTVATSALGDDGDTLVAAAFNAFLKHIVIQAFVVDCPIFFIYTSAFFLYDRCRLRANF